jgi:EAL domain-containing protein (putative c-di-GMP-specific phosphodiesterase class I)/GGDEF domain-containing protein
MKRLLNMARFRRPRGLAARAALFTAGVILLTAVASAATLMFGAERESARDQLRITGDLTAHLANVSGNLMRTHDLVTLQSVVDIAASRAEVRRLSVRDESGRVVAAAGGSASDAATVDRLAREVLVSMRPSHLRAGDGGLALAAPISHQGRYLGVAVMMWDGDAYRFDALPSLAPFLIILFSLVLAAIPLTMRIVRAAVAPLGALAEFAERAAERGEPGAPIDIRTGDEIESLANALNHMMSRLDQSMRQIQEIAFVDPGTRLPNQERFAREIDHYTLQHQADDEHGAVALFELVRLPRLLQTVDPVSERDLLRAIADRLTTTARMLDRSIKPRGREGRAATVARLGVAEFALFAPGLSSPADAARFAQHVNAALNEPFEWRGHKQTLGSCCGLALVPRDGRDADTVIRRARMALGVAQHVPARLKVFTQSLDREAVARMTLERDMRAALENNEFRAYFQPKISLKTGRVEACEALARWTRPDRTIISPGRFIPVAEESGLIGPLSDAIMREACWKAAAWERAGHGANVAVNVSALQFRNDKFAEQVLRVVDHAGLPPHRLELEITETVVMENPERALRIIRPLRDAGVRLAIDDFGCGHSNLAALSKLPFDVIKIDQQFVRALERSDEQAPAIIDMILALARALDLEVVAEGVERRDEAVFMAARGCHWVQGFLYGAAISAPEFAELLRQQARQERADSAA